MLHVEQVKRNDGDVTPHCNMQKMNKVHFPKCRMAFVAVRGDAGDSLGVSASICWRKRSLLQARCCRRWFRIAVPVFSSGFPSPAATCGRRSVRTHARESCWRRRLGRCALGRIDRAPRLEALEAESLIRPSTHDGMCHATRSHSQEISRMEGRSRRSAYSFLMMVGGLRFWHNRFTAAGTATEFRARPFQFQQGKHDGYVGCACGRKACG